MIVAWTAILALSTLAIPSDKELLSRLDHRKHAVREDAEKQLGCRMTWRKALWLERGATALGPEGRARVGRLLRTYWYGWLPADKDLGYIDALNLVNRCSTPNTAFVQKYLDLVPVPCSGWPYQRYRIATYVMVEDLIRMRVPPEMIKRLLSVMASRSLAWDRERGYSR